MATVNPVDWRKRQKRVAVSLKIVGGTTGLDIRKF